MFPFELFIIIPDKIVAAIFPLFHLVNVHPWNDSIRENIEASKELIDWCSEEFPGVTKQVNVSICNLQPHISLLASSILSNLRPWFSTTSTLTFPEVYNPIVGIFNHDSTFLSQQHLLGVLAWGGDWEVLSGRECGKLEVKIHPFIESTAQHG